MGIREDRRKEMRNIDDIQEKLNSTCEELIKTKKELKEFINKKDNDWQPIANLIEEHRKKFNEDKNKLLDKEQELKNAVRERYDSINELRRETHIKTLEAKKRGDMDEVRKLTLLMGDLSLRIKEGVILQQDWDVEIEEPNKLDINILLDNENIRKVIESELKRQIKKNPKIHIPGIKKKYFSCVKVREGQSKKL